MRETMISRFLCLGNMPAERPIRSSLFAFVTRILSDWRQDLADFWNDRIRLPTLAECEQDVECRDCGKSLVRCRCSGGDA